jgi:hypothetical protein
MNYTSLIVKIIEKPCQTFVENQIPLTKMTVQIPQVRHNSSETYIRLCIWGKLGYDITQYYHINDYVIVEGYLSIQSDQLSKISLKSFPRVELSVYKIYPFVFGLNNASIGK